VCETEQGGDEQAEKKEKSTKKKERKIHGKTVQKFTQTKDNSVKTAQRFTQTKVEITGDGCEGCSKAAKENIEIRKQKKEVEERLQREVIVRMREVCELQAKMKEMTTEDRNEQEGKEREGKKGEEHQNDYENMEVEPRDEEQGPKQQTRVGSKQSHISTSQIDAETQVDTEMAESETQVELVVTECETQVEIVTHAVAVQVQRDIFQVMEEAISIETLRNRLKNREGAMREMEACLRKEIKTWEEQYEFQKNVAKELKEVVQEKKRQLKNLEEEKEELLSFAGNKCTELTKAEEEREVLRQRAAKIERENEEVKVRNTSLQKQLKELQEGVCNLVKIQTGASQQVDEPNEHGPTPKGREEVHVDLEETEKRVSERWVDESETGKDNSAWRR